MQKMPRRCPICGGKADHAAMTSSADVNADWLKPECLKHRAGAWLHFVSPRNGRDVLLFVRGWDTLPEKGAQLQIEFGGRQ